MKCQEGVSWNHVFIDVKYALKMPKSTLNPLKGGSA